MITVNSEEKWEKLELRARVRVSISVRSRVRVSYRYLLQQHISNELSLSIGSVETIIHEHLKFSKVSARWVPKQLTDEHKQQQTGGL